MGLLRSIRLRITNFLVFFLIIILLPGIPPRTTFPFKEFSIPPTKELKGALEINQHLEGGERLLDGRVYGPECLIARNNEIYTGIHGGEIIKITAEHVTHVAKIGHPCEDISEEARCGRPLGLAFDTLGNNLIVADAYYGIWEVELATGRKKLLISPNQVLPGKETNRPAKLFNTVAVDQRGDIYWTDSTSDFTLQDLVYSAFANPSGRLFKYDRSKNESKVLVDEIFFANGLALSPTEDFIVISETGAGRLLKFHLKGSKTGQVETFVDGLPGHVDNLTPDADGIWVPLVMAVDSEHPSGFMMFSQFPRVRLFLARLLNILEAPFRFIETYFPNKICQRFIHFIGHGESFMLLAPKRSTIVRVDWNGNIVGSLHGFDKSVGAVSHVLEFQDYLLLGSPWNRYLGRVKSPKAKPANIKVQNVRYEGGINIEPVVKPKVEATAKPPTTTTTTTTTPKPKSTTTTTRTTTTTTTPKPTTTTKSSATTTKKPEVKTTNTPTTTTSKPTTTTTATTAKPTKPAATTKRVPPKEPAPVKEEIPSDTKPPQQEKLKVKNKHGEHIEL